MVEPGTSGRFEKKSGFLRRNWPVAVAAPLAVLLLAGALAYWWLLPSYVRSLVTSVEESLGKITGTSVTHASVEMQGLERLVLTGLVVGDRDLPLLAAGNVEVLVDPVAFSEGLPTVLEITVADVVVQGRRFADGTDNFTAIASNVVRYLRDQERKAGGKPSKLARILRQTPRLVVDGIRVRVDEEVPGEREATLHTLVDLRDGKLAAENPGVSAREKMYAVDVSFVHADGRTKANIRADANLSTRSVAAEMVFSPPLALEFKGQRAEVKSLTYRSGEFAELTLGTISLTNPLADQRLALGLLAKALDGIGMGGYRELLDRALALPQLLDAAAGKLSAATAALHYPADAWPRLADQLTGFVADVVTTALAGTQEERFVVDGARILYRVVQSPAGYATDRMKVSVDRGTLRLADVTVERIEQTDSLSAQFVVTSPGDVLQVSGEVRKTGDRLEGAVDFAVAMIRPMLQVKGHLGRGGNAWQGEVSLQTRSDEPPFALSANAALRDGELSGDAEGSLVVPGVLSVDHFKATMAGRTWTLDLNGTAVEPEGTGMLSFYASLDDRSGVKRCGVESGNEIRVPVGDHDLLVKKARLGRDGVVHVEGVAFTARGADARRAIAQVADVSVTLSKTGRELVDWLESNAGSGSLDELAMSLVSSVQVVDPVIVLRQPASLALSGEEREEDLSDDLAEKMADALGDQQAGAVMMYEPYRKALSGLVLGTGHSVSSLVRSMVRLGDRFPLEQVTIKGGRFEYSDAVSPQDRILSDLSDFNAVVSKVRKSGALAGRFTVDATFSMAAGVPDSGAKLHADVDLGTGDLSGSFEVQRLALYPYRFFLPSVLTVTRTTTLQGAYAGFQYTAEAGRFLLWGKGRLEDLSFVSPRLSPRPIEKLAVDFEVGTLPETGLQFDLNASRLSLGAPLRVGFAQIGSLTVEGFVDASVPDFPRFELIVSLPDMPVRSLLASIPPPMSRALEGLDVEGDFGFSLTLSGDSADLNSMTVNFAPRENGVKLVAPGRKVDFNRLLGVFKHTPPSSDKGETITVGEGSDWVPLSRISPWLVLAVTTCEDGSFFRHSGFNTFQLKSSVIRDLEKGRFARGGSTITMQLVKNLFLSHEKTLSRKLQEAILTWLIEKEIGKERMIEIYLNIIEWGRGIYGVKQACDYYFDGLPPESLNPGQAAFLASFVPSPRPFHDRFKDGGKNPGRRDKAFERWWDNRLKVVRRIVKAMINNCNAVQTKCPSEVSFCRVMETSCTVSRRELGIAENLKSLDVLFRPVDGVPPPVGEQLEF